MRLVAIRGGSDPEPMSEQDLADWGEVIDSKSGVSASVGATPENVINAGEAALAVINGRRGKS